jgi:flagellar basal-body rod modification protein FlgD
LEIAMSITTNLSSITRASDVAAAKLAPSKDANSMGQQDFLKLFTTQLQNQNPLDPTKNEAFVAQLAQFSQLEATTNMATQLTSFVSSQSGDRMLAGASLIGKKVALEGVPATLAGGQPVQGVISLPNGASGMKLEILDKSGAVVRQQIIGAQPSGEITLTWDGRDGAGAMLADGNYTFKATVTAAGATSQVPVKTLTTVRSVSQEDPASELMVLVDGGRSVKMSSLQRISG